MNLLSKLHKNSILTGPVESYCLACGCLLRSEEESYAHIQDPSHLDNLSAVPRLDDNNDCILKSKDGYFCHYCNLILPTIKRVTLHTAESKHRDNKNSQSITRIGNVIFAFESVIINDRSWNGLDEFTCSICNEDYDDEETHKTGAMHVLNLIQTKCEFGKTYVYRKVDDDSFFCLICNLILPIDEKPIHHEGEKHVEYYKNSKKEGIAILSQKIASSEPNNNSRTLPTNEVKHQIQDTNEKKDIKPKNQQNKAQNEGAHAIDKPSTLKNIQEAILNTESQAPKSCEPDSQTKTIEITKHQENKLDYQNKTTPAPTKTEKETVKLYTDTVQTKESKSESQNNQNTQELKEKSKPPSNTISVIKDTQTNNSEALKTKVNANKQSKPVSNGVNATAKVQANKPEPYLYEFLKSNNFVTKGHDNTAFCALCDVSIDATSVEVHINEKHHSILYAKHIARKTSQLSKNTETMNGQDNCKSKTNDQLKTKATTVPEKENKASYTNVKVETVQEKVVAKDYKDTETVQEKVVAKDSKNTETVQEKVIAKDYKDTETVQEKVVAKDSKNTETVQEKVVAKDFKNTETVQEKVVAKDSKNTETVQEKVVAKDYKDTETVQEKVVAKDSKNTETVQEKVVAKDSKNTETVKDKVVTKDSKNTETVQEKVVAKDSKNTETVQEKVVAKDSKNTETVKDKVVAKDSKDTEKKPAPVIKQARTQETIASVAKLEKSNESKPVTDKVKPTLVIEQANIKPQAITTPLDNEENKLKKSKLTDKENKADNKNDDSSRCNERSNVVTNIEQTEPTVQNKKRTKKAQKKAAKAKAADTKATIIPKEINETGPLSEVSMGEITTKEHRSLANDSSKALTENIKLVNSKDSKEHGITHEKIQESETMASRFATDADLKTETLLKLLKTVSQVDSADDVVVNAKYVLGNLSFVLVVRTDEKADCVACDEELTRDDIHKHIATDLHRTNVEDCLVVMSLENEFIRQMKSKKYHCGYCNILLPDWDSMNSHLETFRHIDAKTSAAWRLERYHPHLKHCETIEVRSVLTTIFRCTRE